MTRHCHDCGTEYPLRGQPGRSETCQCGADLRVCLNCVSYEPRVAQQCRDPRAEPVAEKHMATYCEYFEFAQRAWAPKTDSRSREEAARAQLRKFLGD